MMIELLLSCQRRRPRQLIVPELALYGHRQTVADDGILCIFMCGSDVALSQKVIVELCVRYAAYVLLT